MTVTCSTSAPAGTWPRTAGTTATAPLTPGVTLPGWPMVAPVSDVRYLDAADEPPDVVRCVVWIAGE